MKRLLSLVAILILAGALLPAPTHAAYRGAWAPLTFINAAGAPFVNGAEQGALRPGRTYSSASIGTSEAFFAMTTRSLIKGSETVRELWLFLDRDRAGLSFAPPGVPMLIDPAAHISYADPAWSPDGKWLAYVKTDGNVTFAEIWVQKMLMGASSTDVVGAAKPDTLPDGSTMPPILVAGGGVGVINRHPAWSPDGNSIVYDSNASGLSIDLYTQQVFPSVGAANRITFNDSKGELTPTWSPDGSKIAYCSNKFGQFLLFVLDLSTVPNPTDGEFAETNPAPVTHANPKWGWVPGEHVLYYDAPAGEDQNAPPSLWRLDLDTQAKCGFAIDSRGHYQVDASHITNTTADGIKFNYLIFSSTATNLGLHIWRGDYVTGCVPALPLIASFQPNSFNMDQGAAFDTTGAIKNSPGSSISLHMSFPPETQAAGYQCLSFSGPREGVHMRTVRIQSPTVEGLEAEDAGLHGGGGGALGGLPQYADNPGDESMNVQFPRAGILEKILALGLTNQAVPLHVRAYSTRTGRQFAGIGYLTVNTTSKAGSGVKLVQNSPNPFNPQTKISFAVAKPGNVEVRVFNARGELVKTLAKQWFPQGQHTLTWDGRTEAGGGAPSGMYFAIAKANGSSDRIKMMLMK